MVFGLRTGVQDGALTCVCLTIVSRRRPQEREEDVLPAAGFRFSTISVSPGSLNTWSVGFTTASTNVSASRRSITIDHDVADLAVVLV